MLPNVNFTFIWMFQQLPWDTVIQKTSAKGLGRNPVVVTHQGDCPLLTRGPRPSTGDSFCKLGDVCGPLQLECFIPNEHHTFPRQQEFHSTFFSHIHQFSKACFYSSRIVKTRMKQSSLSC
jgi:hypothetical protein